MPRPNARPVIELDGKLWMTVEETARRKGVSRPTIYTWFKLGLPSKKIGRIRRVNVSDLHRWYRAQQVKVEEVTSDQTQTTNQEASADRGTSERDIQAAADRG
jgi:excisionase family DNA binding protein